MAEYFGFQDPGKVSAAPTLDWATVASSVSTSSQYHDVRETAEAAEMPS